MYRIVAIGLIFLCRGADSASAQLPNRLKQSLEKELIPAYLDRETLNVLTVGSKLIAKVPEKHFDQVNSFLKGSGVPELGPLLVDARLELLKSNYQGRIPKPSPRELQLTIPAFQNEIDKSIASIESSDFMKTIDKPAQDFDAYEDMLWKAHVARNQLVNVGHLLKNAHGYANEMKKGGRRRGKNNTKEQPTTLDSFVDLAKQMKALLQNVDERTIELRIGRLQYAINQLKSDDKAQQIKAAWAIEIDGNLLSEWIEKVDADTNFVRDSLNRAGLIEELSGIVENGRELAGEDLLKKSRLFFTGLHWWFRGRYGAGPEGYGFLKRVSALRSSDDMFGLYMPSEKPIPTPPNNSDYPIPEVDRRHHYIWMFEYRRLYTSRSQFTTNQRTATSRTKLSRFY